MNCKIILLMSLMCPALINSLHVVAQSYPSKPVRLIVAYAPGGGTDAVARLVGQQLFEALGQQVVIDNRAGAQGNIGTAAVARAPADGYTILFSDFGLLAINPWVYNDVGFDPIKDFAQIGLVDTFPQIVVAHPGVPATNLKELAALAKAKPDRIVLAYAGVTGQLAGELFSILAGVKMLQVPYKGGGDAVTALLGGHVDVMIVIAPSAVPMVKAGKLRAIAVTGLTRLPSIPDVLTSKESGFPDFEVIGWHGLAAPANTPKDVVTRLNRDLNNVLRMPSVKDSFVARGFEAKSNSPEEMTNFVKSEHDRWGKVVKTAGIRAH